MRPLRALPTPLLVLLATINLPHAAAEDVGVKIEVTTAAGCSRPSRLGDKIAVHYRGTLLSTGEEFDQSYKRGQPFTFTLGAGQVIKGWDEGLQDMCPGEGRKLTIPPGLAYGAFGVPPAIPGGAILVFETELVDIVGVKQESLSFAPSSAAATVTDGFSIATAPPVPPPSFDEKAGQDTSSPTLQGTALTTMQDGECHLLGPFALIVQAALGVVAILSLVFKRWRETPKRPWEIWFFDVSKQVVGSVLLHVLNLAMSMMGATDVMNAAQKAAAAASSVDAEGGAKGGRRPNPCSFYLLNLGIDTTIGIPVLYLLLKILHTAFRFTPLARPPQSIKSGNYGSPPHVTWWLKQSLIYFIGLTGMKLFVWLLFAMLPWLPWVGDWALRWTEGNEVLEVLFVMFIFPVLMNALQYYIIDSFIKDRSSGWKEDGGQGYRQVQQGEEDGDGADGSHDDDDDETVTEESVSPMLKEVTPTPIPEHDKTPPSGSRRPSPKGANAAKEDDNGKRS